MNKKSDSIINAALNALYNSYAVQEIISKKEILIIQFMAQRWILRL
ncbi:MAG: hypothetical protein M0R05_06160 [Bacilli bacterium]|nr:hypothetical protein [Bacilli bacterium]MDD4388628.1 hypothetical protein [Bacilli bacterium]